MTGSKWKGNCNHLAYLGVPVRLLPSLWGMCCSVLGCLYLFDNPKSTQYTFAPWSPIPITKFAWEHKIEDESQIRSDQSGCKRSMSIIRDGVVWCCLFLQRQTDRWTERHFVRYSPVWCLCVWDVLRAVCRPSLTAGPLSEELKTKWNKTEEQNRIELRRIVQRRGENENNKEGRY